MSEKIKTEFILVVVQAVVRHGIAAAIKLIGTLKTKDPTLEEIEAPRGTLKDPEAYFTQE